MQLVEKGLVGLDDDVRPLVPQLAEMKTLRGFVGADVPYLEANTTPITLRYDLHSDTTTGSDHHAGLHSNLYRYSPCARKGNSSPTPSVSGTPAQTPIWPDGPNTRGARNQT